MSALQTSHVLQTSQVLRTRHALPTGQAPRTGPIRACRTCHALYEPAAPEGGRLVRAPLDDADRYCSKACRRAASRRRI